VVLVHRHGARYPEKGNIKYFEKIPNSPVASEWDPSKLENLNEAGIEQLKILGKWFKEYYFGQLFPKFLGKHESFKWRTSPVNRTLQSGKLFWEYFGTSHGPVPSTPSGNSEDDDAKCFRAYKTDKRYLNTLAQVEKGSDFLNKAKEVSDFSDILKRWDVDTKDWTDIKKMECLDALAGIVSAEKFSNGKNAVTSKLNSEEMRKLVRLCRWVHGHKIFIPQLGCEVGGTFFAEILKDLSSADQKFATYSVHDDSILSLLAAMGVDSYPGDTCLGFTCFVVFEVYHDKTVNKNFVKAYLNHSPFGDAASPTTQLHFNPQPLNLSYFIDEWCDLSEMQQRLKLPLDDA